MKLNTTTAVCQFSQCCKYKYEKNYEEYTICVWILFLLRSSAIAGSYTYISQTRNIPLSIHLYISVTLSFCFDIADVWKTCTRAVKKSRILFIYAVFPRREAHKHSHTHNKRRIHHRCYISLVNFLLPTLKLELFAQRPIYSISLFETW